jgi:hypothetical protein
MLNCRTQSQRNRGINYLCCSSILFFFLFLTGCVSERPEEIKKGLVSYNASNIVGYDNQQIVVDSAFVPYMDKINNYARENNVVVCVTHSFRGKNQKLTGTIVPPAIKSNHLVGHAIDMNVLFNNVLYESKDMYTTKWGTLPLNVKNFLCQVRKDPILQWGGDFTEEDPVHIDDRLFDRNPELWQELYDIYQ